MKFSPYQLGIFSHIESATSGACIEAVAGSGKTTTIVEGIKHIPAGETYIFLAFNKSIATELQNRGVTNASTFHSLGFRALPKGTKLDQNKAFRLQDTFMTDEGKEAFGAESRRLAALAKNILVDRFEDIPALQELVEEYELDTDDSYTLAKLTVELLRRMKADRVKIDFDDMLWHPVIHNAHFDSYDNVFVDESQDTNNLQRHILGRIVGKRLFAVGDPYQAIYGFRGANHTAMDALRNHFDLDTLPLHVSYRCPRAVVAEAQRFVPHIQSAEGASDGLVQHIDAPDLAFWKAQDSILCRNTAPLIRHAYWLLSKGIPCSVAGRDIGKSLISWIKKMRLAPTDDLSVMWHNVEAWKRAEEAKPNYNEARVVDRIECLDAFAEGCANVGCVIEKIEAIFSDTAHGVRLSTIHRAKGLEFPNVALIRPDLLPSKYARTPEAQRQESNLAYVAVTRAQKCFSYVTY